MKEKIIGLFGALVNNDNMGCCALTYSLIFIMEKIAKESNFNFSYVIFERNPDLDKVKILKNSLHVGDINISLKKSARFIRMHKFIENKKCIEYIKRCDLIIDMTQGDSFTDIYGLKRFISYSLDKIVIEKTGIPLILGPQTYGPYNKKICLTIAKKIVGNAETVFTRDDISLHYLKSMNIEREIVSVTDVAFALPYTRKKGTNDIKKVGLNISGLLWSEKEEKTKLTSLLQCDYDLLIKRIIKYFYEKKTDIYLVSHVGADYPICCRLKSEYPFCNCVDPFTNPIDAKSFISGMDLFIGSRMHATIAALSTGVPLIPIAYSRKFKGVFESVEYRTCIDLQHMTDDKAYSEFLNIIENVQILIDNVSDSQKIIQQKQELFYEFFKALLIR